MTRSPAASIWRCCCSSPFSRCCSSNAPGPRRGPGREGRRGISHGAGTRAASSSGSIRSSATPRLALSSTRSPGCSQAQQHLGRLLREAHARQPRQPGGGGFHRLPFGLGRHDQQAIESQVPGPRRHRAVQLQAAVPQLEHGAQHREAATPRRRRQQLQSRKHGLR